MARPACSMNARPRDSRSRWPTRGFHGVAAADDSALALSLARKAASSPVTSQWPIGVEQREQCRGVPSGRLPVSVRLVLPHWGQVSSECELSVIVATFRFRGGSLNLFWGQLTVIADAMIGQRLREAYAPSCAVSFQNDMSTGMDVICTATPTTPPLLLQMTSAGHRRTTTTADGY